ncbi:MAG: DEAD/DEAH box helicase family protein [Acetobacter sp.]|nr:DEAD/DEAH box helicase family protein [Acetobacter sp.]
MRPYQITATERIINQITIAHHYKHYGTAENGGFIWHTTGAGKTLTSFKTARIASRLDFIDKVLFFIDRQDLDYQTMKEYDRFEKEAANNTKSTRILEERLSKPNTRIIITTIQKLSRFIAKNKTHDVYQKEVVIIFDECHRSQFGDMHHSIISSFQKYYLFGFTGMPILRKNKNTTAKAKARSVTTEQLFGDKDAQGIVLITGKIPR